MSDYKCYIVNKDFQSYYVQNGTVLLQGLPKELPDFPDGFQDIAINYERNNSYRGMFRSFSVPLGFVRDGKKILAHIFYNYGSEEKSYFIILKKALTYTGGTPDRFNFTYKSYYRGEFDFSTFVQEEDRVTINLLDGGLESEIKANENTQYEIDISSLETRKVKMDGVELKNTVQFLITDGIETLTDNYPYNKNHIVDLTEISRETSGIAGVKATERTKVRNNNVDIKATQRWFFKASTVGNVIIEYDFNLTRTAISSISGIGVFVYSVIRKIDKNGVGSGPILFQTTQPWNLLGTNNIKGTVSIPVNADDELYLYTMCNVEGATGDDVINFNYSGEGLFKVNYTYKHPESIIDTITVYQLFEQLIKKISNGKSGVSSAYLQSRTDLVITSGDLIRNIEGGKIKTNFSDFWQWLRSLLPVYFGVKNGNATIGLLEEMFVKPLTVNLELSNFQTFLQTNQFTYINDVRNLKVSLAKEFMSAKIKVGYPNQNYQDTNGRTEFNSTQNWTTPLIRTSTENNMISPYRSDSIGIEYVRINFDGKKSTDTSSDNDVFVLNVKKDKVGDYYELDRSKNSLFFGVLSPETMFNVALRPRQMLLNNGAVLHSGFDKMDDKSLKFQSADKNSDTVYDSVSDSSEISILSLGNRLFLPYIFEFETYQPIALVEIMTEGNFRKMCIAFDWEGDRYYGYILKAGIQPVTREVQTFTLLAAPQNDMTKLI